MKSKVIYFITSLALILIPSVITAQTLHYGIRMSSGVGTMRSNNLQHYFDRENADDPDIKRYELNAPLGFTYGLGGFIEFPIADQVSLVGEVTFQQQRSNMQIVLLEDDAQSGLTFRDEVKSNNFMRIRSLSIPVMIRYTLKDKSFFLAGGFTTEFVFGSQITAEETINQKEYNASGAVISSQTEIRNSTTSIDVFGSPRVVLNISVGKQVKLGTSDIMMELRYGLGLARSEMYTTSLAFDNAAEESDVFSVYKQRDIAQNEGIALNDFRTGNILLTVSYRIK